jgi:hypothetical protein
MKAYKSSRNDMQEELYNRLGKIEGKLDVALELLREDRKRLTSVERKQWWATGAAAACGALITKTEAFAHMIGLH